MNHILRRATTEKKFNCFNKFPDDNIQKCSIKDSECLKHVTETLKYNLSDNGVPEWGIPPLDPMPIINKTVSVIGMMDITMVEGFAEGMKACKLETFE